MLSSLWLYFLLMLLFLTVLKASFLIRWKSDVVKSVKQGNPVGCTFKICPKSVTSLHPSYSSGSSHLHKFWISAVAS